jgi:hypothetical protein
MKSILSIIFIVLSISNLKADDFKFCSKVDSVTQSGYYKIALSPEVVSAAKSDYSDIRIFDSKHHEIPYILTQEQPVTEHTGFKEYKLLTNNYIPKLSITRVVVSNETKTILSSLVLIVRNSEIEKEITLKGSDDAQNWYIIKKSFPVVSEALAGETNRMMTLDFPKSNYRYFELTLNDKKKDPLQILKVGYYDSETVDGHYTELPAPIIRQTDSAGNHKSFILLTFKFPYEISKLDLTFTGPDFYLRDCWVSKQLPDGKVIVNEEAGRFVISSARKTIWNFDKIRTSRLSLVILNEDNAPLKLVSARAYQLNKYLIANLKPNERYDIYVGQSKLSTPEYDLKYFSDNLPTNMMIIKTSAIVNLEKASVHHKTSFFNRTFLWIVIALVIVLLGWFSIKITKEMGKDGPSSATP